MSVWGVDVGLKHIACVAIGDRGTVPWQIDLKYPSTFRLPDKLALMHIQLLTWWPELWATVSPDMVWVEQPAGRFTNPSLYAAWGIVQASLREGLAPLTNYPTPILPIVPSEWKKIAIGRGDANKEAIMAWAREEGFQHASGDVIDAYGIATAAWVSSQPTPRP
ncbi:MAG TPA: hypothetical protein VIS51_04310 [Solirubrobacterales bacterium]